MEQKNFATENYFVAFIDILGYREKIKKLSDDEQEQLVRSLNEFFEVAKDIIMTLNLPGSLHNPSGEDRRFDINMKTFSDNIFIYTKASWMSLLIAVAHMQANSVLLDVSMRGALSYGKLLANDNLIYGNGLIEAYDLERKVAIFPRIIVSDSFVNGMKCNIIVTDVTEQYKHINPIAKNIPHITNYQTFRHSEFFQIFFANDGFDENIFINYLAYWKWHIEYEGKSESKPSFEELLQIHKEKIEKNLSEITMANVAQKYSWCKFYHNRICDEYRLGEIKIPTRNRDNEYPNSEPNIVKVDKITTNATDT
ncbi:MAG: hypothetical protein FWD05_11030 [Oscillospiraceae bacterium]|nr:hypothetical protein [Oscillospiraceae bacterium]